MDVAPSAGRQVTRTKCVPIATVIVRFIREKRGRDRELVLSAESS